MTKVEKSVNTWMRAFEASLGNKKAYAKRLKELETCDTSNDNPYERLVKIEALKWLIDQDS